MNSVFDAITERAQVDAAFADCPARPESTTIREAIEKIGRLVGLHRSQIASVTDSILAVRAMRPADDPMTFEQAIAAATDMTVAMANARDAA